MIKGMGRHGPTVIATLLAFMLTTIYMLPLSAHTRTVKTNHTGVNLRSGAGSSHHRTISKIRRYEEVQVLETKRLSNGEVWYRVQVRRFPGWRLQEQVGWVDARFFTAVENAVADDQPSDRTTEAQAPCANCANGIRSSTPVSQQQISDVVAAERVRSGGFAWPVQGYVSSGFGYREHPVKGTTRLHGGVDIAGNAEAQVKAAKEGIVEVSAAGCETGRRSCNGGAGNTVTIDHGDGTKTRYLHMSPSCRLPRRGTRVSHGDILGCVGATGAVTGPHLHFELTENGRRINPLTLLPRRS